MVDSHFGDSAPEAKVKFFTKDHLGNFQQDPNQERDRAEQLNPATFQETSGTQQVCCKLQLHRSLLCYCKTLILVTTEATELDFKKHSLLARSFCHQSTEKALPLASMAAEFSYF